MVITTLLGYLVLAAFSLIESRFRTGEEAKSLMRVNLINGRPGCLERLI